MPKKSSGLFNGTKGSLSKAVETNNETNYNSAGSKDVKLVNEVNIIDKDSHPKMPTRDKPNSVTKLIHDGQVDQERYYDGNGDVYLDIDYSNHGNSKRHPIVPHQHTWIKDDDGTPQRQSGVKIKHGGEN